MAFRVGQKVVCVDASSTGASVLRGPIYELKFQAIYTIAWVGIENSILSVRLYEIPVRHTPPGLTCNEPDDWPFKASRFRPVQSTGAGMAILEQIRRDVSNKTALPIREDEQA
jgi:hypothetical protein